MTLEIKILPSLVALLHFSLGVQLEIQILN